MAARDVIPIQDWQHSIRLSQDRQHTFAQGLGVIHHAPEQERPLLMEHAEIAYFNLEQFEAILQKIKHVTESRSQIMFWQARTREELAANLERIAQGYMMGVLCMGLPDKVTDCFSLLSSGSGIVDILVVFSNPRAELQKIVLELKFFGPHHPLNDGIEQLGQYLENEKPAHGYRIIFNATQHKLESGARKTARGVAFQDFVIDIHKPAPSSLD